jgi:hypothetical protein
MSYPAGRSGPRPRRREPWATGAYSGIPPDFSGFSAWS